MLNFHVIDGDHRRRAQIARVLLSRGLHVEIYEDLVEFHDVAPPSGVILATDGGNGRMGEAMREGDIALPVVMYAPSPATDQIVDAVSSGALDFLEWPFDAISFDACLLRIERSSARRAALLRKHADAQARVSHLSARERQVLSLMVQGGSNKAISAQLAISPRTVEIHRGNMMRKLDARSTADAVRIALYAGIDEANDPES